MARALLAAFSFFFLTALPALAQGNTLTLTLVRAVRVSDTAITLSFKTNEPSIGEVAYTDVDGSKFTLTDSVPQTDHLFTINQLDPKNGYSFVLTASSGDDASDTYTVLLSPESIGVPGTSLFPSVAVTDKVGNVVTTTPQASSTVAGNKTIVPWWAFVALAVLLLAGRIVYARNSQRIQQQ